MRIEDVAHRLRGEPRRRPAVLAPRRGRRAREALAEAYADSASYLAGAVGSASAAATPRPPRGPRRRTRRCARGGRVRRLDDTFRSYLAERGAKPVAAGRGDEPGHRRRRAAARRRRRARPVARATTPHGGDRAAARHELVAEHRADDRLVRRLRRRASPARARARAARRTTSAPTRRLVDAVSHDLHGDGRPGHRDRGADDLDRGPPRRRAPPADALVGPAARPSGCMPWGSGMSATFAEDDDRGNDHHPDPRRALPGPRRRAHVPPDVRETTVATEQQATPRQIRAEQFPDLGDEVMYPRLSRPRSSGLRSWARAARSRRARRCTSRVSATPRSSSSSAAGCGCSTASRARTSGSPRRTPGRSSATSRPSPASRRSPSASPTSRPT